MSFQLTVAAWPRRGAGVAGCVKYEALLRSGWNVQSLHTIPTSRRYLLPSASLWQFQVAIGNLPVSRKSQQASS